MQGTGAATASLVLSAVSADVPYMSDEALVAQSGGKANQYTLKRFLELAEALQAKAAELVAGGMCIACTGISG